MHWGKIKIQSIFILLFLFFLSRVFFITTDPVMFDSQEYINRLAERNVFTAITSGHIPYHAGYILLFWPIYHFAKFINLSPLYLVLLSQVILVTLSIYLFYKTLVIFFDKKIALFSTIIVSLIPLFWITNVTIMMETSYVAFFIYSIYFLSVFLKKGRIINLILSSLLFGFSFFAQFSVVLWLPFIIFLAYVLSKKTIYKVFFYYLISLFIFGLINAYLLSVSLSKSFIQAVFLSYISHKDDIPINLSLYGFLVYLRNFLIPLLRNNTNVIIVLGFISLIKLFFFRKKLFWLFFLFIAPSILLNQAWDSLFFGRHSLVVGFGFAVLVSVFLRKHIIYHCILIFYLLAVTIPQLFVLSNVPYLIESSFLKSLPKGLLIRSHFERPYIEYSYKGESASTTDSGLEKKIDEYLKNKQNIFVTSAAISDPYGLYSGPYLHNLSLSYKHSYLLEPLLIKYSLEKYEKIDKKDNLIIYKINRKEKSSYPHVKNMRGSRRRLDFFDPITQIWLVIDNRFNILHPKQY